MAAKKTGYNHVFFRLLLVLSIAPRDFSPGTPVFPSPRKPTFPNSNSTRNQVEEEPLCGCATSKSLFIYSFIHSLTICDDSAPSECYQHKLQPLCFHLCQVPLLSMLRSLQSLKKAINLSERSSRYSWSSLLLGLLKRCLHFTSFFTL